MIKCSYKCGLPWMSSLKQALTGHSVSFHLGSNPTGADPSVRNFVGFLAEDFFFRHSGTLNQLRSNCLNIGERNVTGEYNTVTLFLSIYITEKR